MASNPVFGTQRGAVSEPTATVAVLSKHTIRFRGRHLFNPSNFGLVACFLILGEARAEPLDFWWAPVVPWVAIGLAVILVGGF